jgi:hypothetical protein
MTKDEIAEIYPAVSDSLLEGWLDESFEHRGGIILSEGWSNTPQTKKNWGVVQTWGFQDVDGERKYTRVVYFQNHRPDEGAGKSFDKIHDIKGVKMVYNYVGPLP